MDADKKDISYIARLSQTLSPRQPVSVDEIEDKVNLDDFSEIIDVDNTPKSREQEQQKASNKNDDTFDFGEDLLNIHEEQSMDYMLFMKKMADIYKKAKSESKDIKLIVDGSGPIQDVILQGNTIRFIV
jgi:hypothetical protein